MLITKSPHNSRRKSSLTPLCLKVILVDPVHVFFGCQSIFPKETSCSGLSPSVFFCFFHPFQETLNRPQGTEPGTR